MFDQNYFLTRLQNGEDLDKIGKEIVDMMNKASAEFTAQKEAEAKAAAEAEKNAQKKELVEELIDIIQKLATLEGMDPEDMDVTDEDIDELAKAFTEMFAAMRDLKKLFASIDTDKVVAHAPKARKATFNVKPSDDQILADFLKTII